VGRKKINWANDESYFLSRNLGNNAISEILYFFEGAFFLKYFIFNFDYFIFLNELR